MYRNIAYVTHNRQGYIWISTWDENGNRIEKEVPHQSYIFYEDPKLTDSPYKSMFGVPLKKMEFNSSYERKQWCEKNRGTRLFEELPPVREYLMNEFWGKEREPEFAQYPFRVFCVDIEVQIEDEFPTADNADYPINVISLTDSMEKKLHVWAFQEQNIDKILNHNKQQDITKFLNQYDNEITPVYHTFDNEVDLLDDFINYWRHNFPDIATGWNCVDINSPIWLSDRISLLKNVSNSTNLYNNNYIKHIFPTENKQKYIINLINGYSINSSKDHQFEVFTLPHNKYTNFCAKHDVFEFKTIENVYNNLNENNFYVKIPKHLNHNRDLTYRDLFSSSNIYLNDRLLLNKDLNCLNNKSKLVLRSKTENVIDLNEAIDIDLCYTLGLLYTDGTRDFKSNEIIIYNKNISCLLRASNVFDRYKCNNGRQKKNNIHTKTLNRNNKIYTYSWIKTSSNTTLGLLADNFIYNEKNKKLNVELLSRLSERQFFAFLSGLIDGDGNISKDGSVNWYNFNNDCCSLHQLLLWNNIYNNITKNIIRINKTKHNIDLLKQHLTLCIDYKREHLFNGTVYKDKPNKSNNINFMDCGDFYAVKINNIEKTNEFIPMCDIETKTHTFNIDGVSVHNCTAFDFKYIINRIEKVLGSERVKDLSPLANVYKTFDRESNSDIYHISGISIIDYLPLYKKITLKSQQSFKLDYIGEMELGFGKLDYHDKYSSIRQFMEAEFDEFTKYNMLDSLIVYLLDKKLKFINLMRTICNFGLVEYEAIMRSLPYIIGALCIEARKKGVYYLTELNKPEEQAKGDENNNDYGFAGAFVYPTIANYYRKGIASFDFNSLYPNIMITLNLSPDTKVGKVISSNLDSERIQIRKTSGKIITVSKEQFKQILDTQCSISATNVLYLKSTVKKGIVPGFLQDLYESRKAKKKLMLSYEKKSHDLDSDIEKLNNAMKQTNNTDVIHALQAKRDQLIEMQKDYDIKAGQLDAIQHSFKIYLNSSYGAFGSVYYPCFDLDNAESVTQTGQCIIKEMLRYLQDYFMDPTVFKDVEPLENEPVIVARRYRFCFGEHQITNKNIKNKKNYNVR